MAPSLRKSSYDDKIEMIRRRLVSQSRGLGYWAAIDAMTYSNIRMFINIDELPLETKLRINSRPLNK